MSEAKKKIKEAKYPLNMEEGRTVSARNDENLRLQRRRSSIERKKRVMTQMKRMGLTMKDGVPEQNQCWSTLRSWISKHFRWWLFGSLILLYFFLGALFYSRENGWSYSAGLFYASQAGWSVGYASMEEKSRTSLWFTIFFVAVGATATGGAIAVLMSYIIEKGDIWEHEERMREMMRHLHQPSVSFSTKTITDLNNFNKKVKDSRSGCEIIWYYAYQIFAGSLLLLWSLAGIFYGIYHEKWSFLVSLYFSITSLATGGLRSPTIDTENDSFANWFVGGWILLGVPVYSVALGMLAGLFVEAYTRNQLKRKLEARIKEEDIYYAKQMLRYRNRSHLTFGDYLEFNLLRTGMMSPEKIQELHESFEELDIDGDGTIGFKEMKAAVEFARFDVDGDGNLMIEEFVAMCLNLGMADTEQLDDALDMYENLDIEGKGITQSAFCNWWIKGHIGTKLNIAQTQEGKHSVLTQSLANSRRFSSGTISLERTNTKLNSCSRNASLKGGDLRGSRNTSKKFDFAETDNNEIGHRNNNVAGEQKLIHNEPVIDDRKTERVDSIPSQEQIALSPSPSTPYPLSHPQSSSRLDEAEAKTQERHPFGMSS